MPTVYGCPNCVGWFVAGVGVTADGGGAAGHGDAVAGWADQSGAGNHLGQPTPADRPTFAAPAGGAAATVAPFGEPMAVDRVAFAPAVAFDGATSLTVPPSLALPVGGCTVVLVTRGAAGTPVTVGGLAYGAVGVSRLGFATATGPTPFPAATGLPTFAPIVHGFRCDAAAELFVGTNQRSGLPRTPIASPLVGGSVGRGFVGDVRELLVFDAPLSDDLLGQLLADVQAAHGLVGATTQVVFVGDELTTGGPGPPAVSAGYPAALWRLAGGTFKPVVVATPGHTVAQQQALVNTAVLPLDRSAFASNAAVVCVGGTDLWAGAAPADVAAAVGQLCGSLRAGGFTTVVATLPPRAAATAAGQVTASAAIDAFNAAVRSGHPAYADGLVDLAIDRRLADYTDAAYFAPDGWHTTPAGDAVKAALVQAALSPVGQPSAAVTVDDAAADGPLTYGSFYAAGRTLDARYGRFPRS